MTSATARSARLEPCAAHDPAGPLVLVNSLGTTSSMWDGLVPVLRTRFDVVCYEQRGYGAEDAPDGPFWLGDLVDDLIDVLDGLGLERAHLAGTSLGGMVAARAAARHPHRVRSVTIMCSAPVLPRDPWLERARAVRDGGLAVIHDTVVKRWFTPEFAAGHPDVVRRYGDMLLANDTGQYARACEMLAAADVRPDLGSVAAPTLVIGGSADIATPPETQEVYAAGIPGARLLVLDGVGHMAPAAVPVEIAREIVAHAGHAHD
ncbi:alpha/beta fold hydrolase [Nonomuraea angiospora]|uniref:3-oxoadipate enol-lactonase n=1 Tax=Nonomuraea angiospora TaxID=46172 RepID=A0ABR9MGT6_9ACTN|nr:alpha/beta fold hydrolase [Nonomuraea angiospora]MBE1592113.1 3-oxoadipate enol-lactonase [Nonomuraea angiospora]